MADETDKPKGRSVESRFHIVHGYNQLYRTSGTVQHKGNRARNRPGSPMKSVGLKVRGWALSHFPWRDGNCYQDGLDRPPWAS